MIVILIIGVLLGVAIPSFINARARSRQRTCMTNMKQINGAKEQFAMQQNLNDGAPVAPADLVPAYIKEFPACPEGGVYTINPIGTSIVCTENAGPYAHIAP